jgi:putative aldouronate transport system substrate-binding protein
MAKKDFTRREILKIIGGASSGGAIFAALTAAGVLTGCAATPQAAAPAAEPTAAPEAEKPAEPTAAPEAAASACQMDWNPAYPPFQKYDPIIEIATPYTIDTPKFPDGVADTLTDNPMSRRIKDTLGIVYTMHWQAAGEVATQKMKADIAGNSLAEVFHTGDTELADLIANDAVTDIKDIWEATASPLVKEKKKYPDGKNWVPVKAGGKLYGVAFSWGPGYNVDNIGWIRQDWLDKVGMKVPETLDELTATIKAFKEQKLSAFGINSCKNLVTWYQSLDPIFGAFGVMPTIWRKGSDGQLAYDSLTPAVKDALNVLRGWYADGLLDPDFYTYGEGDSANNLGAQKAGAFFGPWWSGATVVQPMWESVPDAKWVNMPSPKGPDGKVGRIASGVVGPAVVFKKGIDPKKVEAAINQLNWQTEMHVNWEKYQQYGEQRNSNGFINGYDWAWDDQCNVVKGPIDNSYVFVNAIGFGFPYMCYPDYQADINLNIVKWFDQPKDKLNKAQQYLLANPTVKLEAESYLYVYNTLDTQIENEYLSTATPGMIKSWADLRKIEDETFIGIVIGNKPLEDFDTFVADWKANGGDTVTQEVNEWLKSQS